ncbi:MAG TPA: LamG-like jellyroll fold domain-containing protein, partial [Kofleriaceae bacterium]
GHHHDVDVVASSTAPALVPGITGQARSFNGTTDRLCGADSDQSLQFGKASFSFELWVNVAQNLSGMDRPFTFGGSTAADTGFDFELGAGYWTPNISDGTTLLNVMAINGTLGTWIDLAGVVDREQGQLLFYEHGILRGMTPIPATFGGIDMDRPICFSGGLAKFDGLIDEARVYAGALDAARIRAAYANLAERSGFVAIGPETRAP